MIVSRLFHDCFTIVFTIVSMSCFTFAAFYSSAILVMCFFLFVFYPQFLLIFLTYFMANLTLHLLHYISLSYFVLFTLHFHVFCGPRYCSVVFCSCSCVLLLFIASFRFMFSSR